MAALAVVAVSLIPASAAITVLRLNETTAINGFITTTTALNQTGAPAIGDNDDAWGFNSGNTQAGLGTGNTVRLAGYVWGSRVDLGENAPAFTTAISGLNASTTYNVYGYHVTDDGTGWGLQMGLNGGGLATYTFGGGTGIQTNQGLTLERVLLGQFTGSTTVGVNFDDTSGITSTGEQRSFAKGVGIEVVPEPSSAAMTGLACLILAARRRVSR